MLSVLLGLLANQWRIASANEKQAEQSLQAIHEALRGRIGREDSRSEQDGDDRAHDG